MDKEILKNKLKGNICSECKYFFRAINYYSKNIEMTCLNHYISITMNHSCKNFLGKNG
jgi:hypothetical protein